MKRKMVEDRIPSCRQSPEAQWAAIQAHSLTLALVTTTGGGRAVLLQTAIQGRCLTKCLDILLKDIAKEYSNTLESLKRA